MSPEEKREDDIFEVEDVDDTPPPQEFKRPKGLLDLQAKKEQERVELKSGAAGGKPPPLTPTQRPALKPPPVGSRSAPVPAAARPKPSPPVASGPEVRTERPTPKGDPKLDALRADVDAAEIRMHKAEPSKDPRDLERLRADVESAEIRMQKAEPSKDIPKLEVPDEFDVKQDQTKGARPALQPLEGPVEVVKQEPSRAPRPMLRPLEGPVEVLKPAAEARPKVHPVPTMEGELQIVKDLHAKTPQSDRLKVTKPRKLIGVVDTTFARYNMGEAAQDELRKMGGEYDVMRRTVPGIKDLAVECKILLEEEDCDLVIACGMVGGQPIDKQCAHEASLAIQWAMLSTNRHILEVFVHEDEAKDDAQLAWLMERRTREHAVNAHWMVEQPEKLQEMAGQGLRQGFDDAGPVRRS